MPGPGGLILCPGYAPTTSGSGAESMAEDAMSGMDMSDHDMGMDHGGKTPAHESMGICPFAAAGTTFAFFHTPVLAAYTPVFSLQVKFAPQPFIPRAAITPNRLPRGPPAFG
jgi:hypothetical protein